MNKVVRHFARKKVVDDDELRRLWPSHITDNELARKMGHSKGVLRRRAYKLGLAARRDLWAKQ